MAQIRAALLDCLAQLDDRTTWELLTTETFLEVQIFDVTQGQIEASHILKAVEEALDRVKAKKTGRPASGAAPRRLILDLGSIFSHITGRKATLTTAPINDTYPDQ